jgi:antirestriction protein ArdC
LSDSNTNAVYDKLTPQRKQLVDEVLKNLETGTGLWRQGWKSNGAPVSAITGKKYSGVNRLFLTEAAMRCGYGDNRWLTYNQMEDRGWSFKRDAEGNNLGKGAGVSIEFFELRDKETKLPFDRHVLDGMSAEEKEAYVDENVFPIRKYYRVFNADVIEGIPERERGELDPTGYSERAENILKIWNDTESKIIYGGDKAFYRQTTDEIHLPHKEDFTDLPEFYGTALHEVGHSTGHEKRLNRSLSGGFGSSEYAEEELRAEIASMFIEQDLEIAVGEKHIENNSAYIQSWKESIKENPNVLFTAIADAERIAKFVTAKEQQIKKEVEPFAIVEEQGEYGEMVYKVMMITEYGQTRYALSGYPFRSKDALTVELNKMQELSFWKNKEFSEVSIEELEQMSRDRAKAEEEKRERLSQVKEEQSEEFMPPSEVATKILEKPTAINAVNMTGRGIESLLRMDDREVVDAASKTARGEKFLALFNGERLLGNEEKDERSLMSRIAMYTGSNEEQLLRIFKASGQYRDEKPNVYYEKMAKEEINFVASLRSKTQIPVTHSTSGKSGRYANSKS